MNKEEYQKPVAKVIKSNTGKDKVEPLCLVCDARCFKCQVGPEKSPT